MDRFNYGNPYSKDGKMICPNCSKFEGHAFGVYPDHAVITEPVFLVVRTNKATDEKFLGCPNFPHCKHSDDTASMKRHKAKMRIFEIDWEDELRPY